MIGAIASRRKTGSARGEQPRARRFARLITPAYVLVAVAISVAVSACVLLLVDSPPALAAWP